MIDLTIYETSDAIKDCRTCLDPKPLSDFYNHRTTRDGKSGECKLCTDVRNKKWRAENRDRHNELNQHYRLRNPEKILAARILYKNKMTLEERNALFDRYEHRCGACNNKATDKVPLCVDHCHDTLAIRGVLCRSCNAGLGFLGDQAEGVEKVLAYLKEGCR